MKKKSIIRLAKLAFSLLFIFACKIRSILYRIIDHTPPGSCVILYYHSVTCGERQRFASQMDILLRYAKPIRIDGGDVLDSRLHYVGVTFDDGLQSVIDNAAPELEKRRIPWTWFVCASMLGQQPSWWEPSDPRRNDTVVSLERLKELSQDLVSIGSHTLTHPMLLSLSDKDAWHEISDSRSKIEELLDRTITLLSFPFGAFNQQLVDQCRAAGYKRVFTSLPFLAFRNPDEFVTGRIAAEPCDWPLEFRLKLLGAYRWMPWALSCKRWLRDKSSIARHDRLAPAGKMAHNRLHSAAADRT